MKQHDHSFVSTQSSVKTGSKNYPSGDGLGPARHPIEVPLEQSLDLLKGINTTYVEALSS
jgi:hypothetical protein